MSDATAVKTAADIDWAIVTPSYAGDYERCLLLCESMDEFVTGDWHHYIIVDKPHYEMFKHLEGERRSVWLTDDVVPVNMRLLFHVPFVGGRSVWWSRELGLSLGWHMQQMVKIGMAHKVKQQALAYLDSDVFFLRPIDLGNLVKDGHVRFYRHSNAEKIKDMPNGSYARAALKMLHLPTDGLHHGYVDNFVTWRKSEVLAMCDYLAKLHGGKWYYSFRHRIQVSEYMLYGIYADEIDKTWSTVYPDSKQLCRTIWTGLDVSEEQVIAFCRDLRDQEVAIGVQSFLGVSVDLLRGEFERARSEHLMTASAKPGRKKRA